MARKYFGTDGIRGRANSSPMDAETALKVGMAAGHYFTRGTHRHKVVIGKDTRLPGYLIENALTAGFIAAGMDVLLVGPLPTPAVAMITRSMRADIGVMISASHNTYEDNGIKLFNPNGTKLSDEVEIAIEKLIDANPAKLRVSPENLGRAKRIDDAAGRYVEYVKFTFPKRQSLDGLKVVVDCANGASYNLAPTIFWELGAEVVSIGVDPNGFNINKGCGSTYPSLLCETVKREKADIGIALDGDADRVIACDENGEIIDGDQIMASIATYWKNNGKLQGGGIVATQMSNLAMEKYLNEQGLHVERVQVGDRYVVAKMREKGYNLGGEQSGHIIFSDFTTTGDGLVAALQMMAFIVEEKKKASKALRVFKPMPQILTNVKFSNNSTDPLKNKNVKSIISSYEKSLAGKGRIFIRKSGTEPLIRVMVEGEDKNKITKISQEIALEIKKAAKNK